MNTYMSAFSAKLLNMLVANPDIDLAVELNIDQDIVDGLLDGSLIPSLQIIYRIAHIFQLDWDEKLLLYEIGALSYIYSEGDDEDIPDEPDPPTNTNGKLNPTYIKTLPIEGIAWENVLKAAQTNTDKPNLSDQDDKTDTNVLAKALVWVRTNEPKYRNEVIKAIENVMGTEEGSSILAVVRNITPYVLAAELIGLDGTLNANFTSWINTLRHEVFSGAGPSLSIIECHEKRPNNFGTHAGAARLVIAKYLNDSDDLAKAIKVFKGWLGDRNEYAGFSYGDLSWQCDPDNPVGINPKGCTKDGHNIDGVLPDDQRRSGSFTWPPPKESYCWEGMQGVVLQAELLANLGYSAWAWSDNAIYRAFNWLYNVADYPAEGDDDWLPWIINNAYETNFPTVTPTNPGKAFGWTDWIYG